MTRTRKWTLATAALVLVVLLAGWFLLVSPKRASADDLRGQASAQESQNDSLRNQIKTLQAQEAMAPQQEAKLAAMAQQIPQTPALPAYIRSLSAAASSAGVEFESLQPAAPAGLAVTATSATSAGVSTSAGLAAANGLQQMTVNMTVQGPYASIERFVAKLEQQRRASIVTGIVVKYQASMPVPNDAYHQAQITVRVFVAPPVAVAPAAPSTGASSAPASPTNVTQ